jgi:hypothetical protein
MLILPLFATYLEIINGTKELTYPSDITVRDKLTEGFNTDYNNIYEKNGEVIETDGVKYDIISALYLIMRGYNANYYYRWGIIDNICIVLLYILTLLISIFAAYLSFSCTWKGLVDNIIVRLLFAFVAFMLGPFYLVWYLLVNYLGNLC